MYHKILSVCLLIASINVSINEVFSLKDKLKQSNYDHLLNKKFNDNGEKFGQILIDGISVENIRKHLRILTNSSHMAGTSGDLDSANYVYNTWKAQNLDYIKIIDYEVLLAYPDPSRPNSLEILDETTGKKDVIEIVESAYDPEFNYTYIPRPFLAYSIKGSYTSDKVYYANYCTLDDFIYLKNKAIDLKDAIIICRYGEIFRGNKVKLATQYGAKGVLIYEDPIRGAPTGENVYPDGEFLPGDGMQRGTLITGNGDPLTPMYPSTKDGYRLEENEVTDLPTIVAQVIGYDHVKVIFKMLEENKEVDEPTWKGGMNVKYTYGGKLTSEKKLTINVYNERKKLKTYNVIGAIKGTIEPDRYVLMGNHRDAWVLGAIDPTSGTATMLEVSRVLSQLRKNKGWVPKRSILFLSWGAEEYGLIGSTEWEYQKKLSQNGIAYINVDVAVQGNYSLSGKSSPLLFDLINDVTKRVKINNNETVFDRWREYSPNEDGTKPDISSMLGSGSDFMAFQQRLGLPCADFEHVANEHLEKYKLLGSSYAAYHSSIETFNLVDKYIDPGFKSFRTVAQVVGEIVRRLADSIILPFNCTAYANDLKSLFKQFEKSYGDILNQQDIKLDGLKDALRNFENSAKRFHKRLNKINKKNVLEVRQFNDQMKNLEKAFLDPSGISRNGYQHMISAPSLFNIYGGNGFPALSDAIFNAINDSNNSNWKEVKRQLSIVIYVINSASSILDEPVSFEREFN